MINQFEKRELRPHEFIDYVEKLGEKLIKLHSKQIKYDEKGKKKSVRFFTVFQELEADKDSTTIQVSEPFSEYFKEKLNYATFIELKYLYSIKTSRSKTMYRYLMQFKSTGIWRISVDDFRFVMGLSEKYTEYNIKQKVIKKSIEELTKKDTFGNQPILEITHRKYKNNDGIDMYEFKFTANRDDFVDKDILIPDNAQIINANGKELINIGDGHWIELDKWKEQNQPPKNICLIVDKYQKIKDNTHKDVKVIRDGFHNIDSPYYHNNYDVYDVREATIQNEIQERQEQREKELKNKNSKIDIEVDEKEFDFPNWDDDENVY